MRFRASAAAIVVATALVAAGATAFASQSGPGARHPRSGAELPVVTRFSDGLVTWSDIAQPRVLVAGADLYLSWMTSHPGSGRAPVREELARVDATSGKVRARRSVEGQVVSALVDDGSLLVLVTSNGEDLVRLDPTTLAETGHWRVGGASAPDLETSAMVRAGGAVWITTGPELVRFTTTRWRVSSAIPIPGAADADLATTPTGSVLLLGEATGGGLGHIQRRDVVTGQLVAESPALIGIARPGLTSVTGNDFWISEATGMMGHVEEFVLTSLTPTGTCRTGIYTEHCIFGTNGLTARISAGTLFVTQEAGGPALNFCADRDGRVLAQLRIPASDSVLAVGRTVLFLLESPSPRSRTLVKELAIPRPCRAG